MTENLRPVPWWQIWVNPIFLRYTRSRLRLAPLITWIIIVLTVATSIFFLFYYSSLYRLEASPPAAARDAFYPILFFQMVILLFMGTGSVAGGISREVRNGRKRPCQEAIEAGPRPFCLRQDRRRVPVGIYGSW